MVVPSAESENTETCKHGFGASISVRTCAAGLCITRQINATLLGTAEEVRLSQQPHHADELTSSVGYGKYGLCAKW